VGVLVHQVIEVCDFPLKTGLVINWENAEEVGPFNVRFKTNHVLYELGVVAAKKDLAVVLILNKHLHW
jgi:hypothetical protein